MISKEIIEKIYNVKVYGDINTNTKDAVEYLEFYTTCGPFNRLKNIYEVQHKCLEFAYENGYEIVVLAKHIKIYQNGYEVFYKSYENIFDVKDFFEVFNFVMEKIK